MLYFFIGCLFGLVSGLFFSTITLILFARKESVITRFIEKNTENKEPSQFLEPISNEEIINDIFKQNE